MRLFHVTGERMSFAARLPTLACAVAGWLIHIVTADRTSQAVYGRSDWRATLLVGFVAWLGCGVVGWSALSIRPDLMAAMLTMTALSMCLAAVRAPASDARFSAIAGCLFAAAWCTKHSYVMSMVGSAGYFAWRRRGGAVLGVTLPCVAVVAAALLEGSPAYRFAILHAQALNPVRVHDAQFWLRAGLLPNALVWAVPAWSLVTRGPLQDPRRETVAEPFVLLGVVSACVGLWTVLTIGKAGASEHYLIEPNVIGALWTSIVLSGWSAQARGARDGFRIAFGATAIMLAFVLAVLTRADVVRNIIGLRARGDRLTLGVPGELQRRQNIASTMNTLPPPIFIDDETLAQPWFSTRGGYPATVIEHVVFDAAERRGLLGTGLAGLYDTRYFGTVIVSPESVPRLQVRRAGYRLRATIPGPIGNPLEIYTR